MSAPETKLVRARRYILKITRHHSGQKSVTTGEYRFLEYSDNKKAIRIIGVDAYIGNSEWLDLTDVKIIDTST